jgi:flagellin
MFSVNTNLGAMAALNSLNLVEASLKETQNAISTGKKISSGADNPAVYTIAQTMQANVQGLTAVADSLNFGTSVVSTAMSATTQIGSVLAQLKNTITQGQQTGMNATAMNASITQMLANINQIAQSATFNGVNLTSTTGVGATSTTLSVVDNVAGNVISVDPATDAFMSDTTGLGITSLTVSDANVKLSFANDTAPVSDDTITLTNGTKSWTFMLSDENSTGNTAFANASGTNQDNSYVNILSTDSNNAIMAKLATAMQAKGFGATTSSTGDLIVSGNGVIATGSSFGFATAGGETITSVTGTTTAIAEVDAAITKLNTNAAYLGAKQNQLTGMSTYTTQLSTALTAGIGALTDADMAAESAKLQSLQTRQSLAIQSLSIANQQPQSIMTLFR